MSFVIFDTEYTSWEGCLQNGWNGNRKKEIVQIAAIKISDDFEVIDEFNVFCKPKINPLLSDYFIELTKITNEKIAKDGVSFETAYNKFREFVGEDVCFSHSWGGEFFSRGDGDVITENLKINNINDKNDIEYRNIAPIFVMLYEKYDISVKSQSSGEIIKVLGIDTDKCLFGNVHNALFDVYSIYEGLKFFDGEKQFLSKYLR